MTASDSQESLAQLRRTWQPRLEWIDGSPWETISTGGPGEPVVLLPGAQGTGEVFFKVLLRLGQRRRLVAVHYPPESDGRELAGQFATLLDRWRVPRASIVGSSFGAYWAQLFAHQYPHRIHQLLLGNTFIDATDVKHLPAFNEAEVLKLDAEQARRQKIEKIEAGPDSELKSILLDQLARQTAESVKSRSLGVARSIVVPPLALSAQQVCVLDCLDDAVITPLMKQQVAQRYAACEILRLPTGGHYPHILNPDAYVSLLRRRLAIS